MIYVNISMIRIAIKFNPNPAFAIWGIFICPLAKILAFGPVPDGSINAQDAAIVAGTIKRNGWYSPAFDIPAKIGKKIAVDAAFEFISVKKTINVTIKSRIIKKGIPSKLRLFPIQMISPDDLNEDAIANPPPINIPTPQGIVFASSHSKSLNFLPISFCLPLGTENKIMDAKIATVESLT